MSNATIVTPVAWIATRAAGLGMPRSASLVTISAALTADSKGPGRTAATRSEPGSSRSSASKAELSRTNSLTLGNRVPLGDEFVDQARTQRDVAPNHRLSPTNCRVDGLDHQSAIGDMH